MKSVVRFVLAAAAIVGADTASAQFISTPVTTAHEGLPYRYDVVATGIGAVRITAPNGLPPWLSLVETGNGTALLSGIPSAGDSGDGIVLRAEDTACPVFLAFCARYQFFDIAVAPNGPPEVIAPINDQRAVEATPFRLDFAGTFDDPDGDALSYSVAGLPVGLSVSGTVIAGTPAPADVGGSPYDVAVSASDGRGGTAVERFVLRIDALARADLAIASVAPVPSPALVGQSVDWSFRVVNRGPSESGDAELEIVLVGSEVELDPGPCASDAAGGTRRAVCSIPPIGPDAEEAVSVRTTSAGAGDVHVTARVRPIGDRPIDPAAANDVYTAALNVGEVLRTDAAQRLEGTLLGAAAGDVDGDGFDDLVAATPEDAPAALHLNIEDPAGLDPVLLESGAGRRGLSTLAISLGDAAANADAALADLDGDGDLDAVVVNAPGTVAIVLENEGAGGFVRSLSLGDGSADTRAVATGDLDGDGVPDLAATSSGAEIVTLVLSTP